MKVLTPMKAIRAKCLDCCCGSSVEVKLCPVRNCPLFSYRFGHRPKAVGGIALTEDETSESGGLGGQSTQKKAIPDGHLEVSA